MDEVFGEDNFGSLITFTTTTTTAGQYLPGTASYIIWYGKDAQQLKFRQLFAEKAAGGAGATKYDQIDDAGRPYRLDNLTSPRVRTARTGYYRVEVGGREFLPLCGEWKTNQDGMSRLLAAGRIKPIRNTLSYIRFLDDFPAYPINNVWLDIGGIQSRADPKVYVVQTSASIIQRCMLMTTDPGDLTSIPHAGRARRHMLPSIGVAGGSRSTPAASRWRSRALVSCARDFRTTFSPTPPRAPPGRRR
jgi:adenine-specific DNA-methyltransferase